MLLTYMDSDMLQHMPLSVQPLVVLEPRTPSAGPAGAPPPTDTSNVNTTVNSVSLSPLLAPASETQVAACMCLPKTLRLST